MIAIIIIFLVLLISGIYKRGSKSPDLIQYRNEISCREAEKVKKAREKEQKRKIQVSQALIDTEYYKNRIEELNQLLEIAQAKEKRQLKKLENNYNKGSAIGEKVIEKDIKEYERLKRQVITLENQIYNANKKLLNANSVFRRG